MTATLKKTKLTEEEQVNEWMNKLDTQMKPAVNAVRKIIKTAGPKLNERIKWNAPSYYYKEDIVTFGPARSKDKIILVFHHPNIVKIGSSLLQGDYKDRRLVYFNSLSEIRSCKKELERIINESVKMMDK
ncbi:MAG TPA: DUF1801 domain-containing protein [Chitinophagaceae bacterium]|nr:DUF1801 domain-containing protein [Chitinophagaceae bacterium]